MYLPDRVLPFKEPRTKIKAIKGGYYKYQVSYKYDPNKKRTSKSILIISFAKKGLFDPINIKERRIV